MSACGHKRKGTVQAFYAVDGTRYYRARSSLPDGRRVWIDGRFSEYSAAELAAKEASSAASQESETSPANTAGPISARMARSVASLKHQLIDAAVELGADRSLEILGEYFRGEKKEDRGIAFEDLPI